MTATAQIITFPRPLVIRSMRHVTLLCLTSDKVWATAGFTPGDPGAPWAWIQETVAREFGCAEDAVKTLETDDCDMITADGMPVCRVKL